MACTPAPFRLSLETVRAHPDPSLRVTDPSSSVPGAQASWCRCPVTRARAGARGELRPGRTPWAPRESDGIFSSCGTAWSWRARGWPGICERGRVNRHTACAQLAPSARSRAKKLSGAVRVGRRRPREEGEREGRGGGGWSEAGSGRCEAPAGTPGPGAVRPRVYAFASASESVFPFPQISLGSPPHQWPEYLLEGIEYPRRELSSRTDTFFWGL